MRPERRIARELVLELRVVSVCLELVEVSRALLLLLSRIASFTSAAASQ